MMNDSAAHIIYAINGINTEQYTGCSAKTVTLSNAYKTSICVTYIPRLSDDRALMNFSGITLKSRSHFIYFAAVNTAADIGRQAIDV